MIRRERVVSRLLILGLNFHPEMVGIGKYTGDLADYLVEQGYEIRVVAAPPYYPEWKIREGYSSFNYLNESNEGITIYRCPIWVPRRPTNITRVLHLISFAVSSAPILMSQIFWKPDLVLCVVPTLLTAPFAWLAARLSGAKCWLHIQDFELDAASKLGMLPGVNKFVGFFERIIFTRFDRVSTISESMLRLLLKKGVSAQKGILFPNWVDTKSVFPRSDDNLRDELSITSDQLVVLYSGSMGAKQGLEILVEVARQLESHREIVFVLCGEGPVRNELIDSARDLPNVRFLPLQPMDKLNPLLNTADIHILPQKADVADLVMPSKLLGMLASGKTIIATAMPETEIGRVVGQVGVLVPPRNSAALCEAILGLSKSTEQLKYLGESGRSYVCDNWGKDMVLQKFLKQMDDLLQKGN